MEKTFDYIDSVMNFTGSKFKLLEQLLPFFDYDKKYFFDVFTGGGSVYINVVDRYEKIIVNDIISDLIGIHQKLVSSDDIINDVKSLCPKKDDGEGYQSLRKSYNEDKTPEKLWALMLSCTNNMMRFNQSFEFNQTWGKRTFSDNTMKKINSFISHVRPHKDKLIFISSDFYKINISKPSMVYLDPPYGRILNGNGDISNKQISEAGYNPFWKKEHDIKLYEYVHKIDKNKSSFMVSGVLEHDGNICWMLDKLIKDGFTYKELDYNYNKVSRKNIDKGTKEIIIMNY